MHTTKLLSVLFVATLLSAGSSAVEIDGIAAKVGSETILKSDVYNELQRMGERDETRFAAIRNEMIDRKLILKAASLSKMTMQEWLVENRVREIIKKAFDGDRNRLIEMLGRQKLSYPEWYARMKEDMIVNAMRWNVVDKNVSASPAEMRREYEAHPDRYAAESSVTLTVLTLAPSEVSRRAEISMALKEKDLVALGGKVYEKIKPEDQFCPEICKEVAEMPKGTISHWIEIDGWSYLIRKNDESSGRMLSFEEAFDAIEANVKEANAARLYDAWIERLRAETYIRVY